MPKTASRKRWATCVQRVYGRWLAGGQIAGFIHLQVLVSRRRGINWHVIPVDPAFFPSAFAHLFYSNLSVQSYLSPLYTGPITTTTTYKNIGV
jgi:hypothetical protein